ncbi:response regulator [bacterium]|nr:response regulator [bacterium]
MLPTSATTKKRLLFIDDEQAWLTVLPKLLKDYDVSCACGAEPALALLRQDCAYDVIFCDVCMPGMGGRELFSLWSAERPDTKDLFVFMSGGETLNGISNTLLEKPLPVSKLRQFLNQRLPNP